MMESIRNSMDMYLIKTKGKIDSFIEDQRGDTNFISIAIVLVIVLIIAVVFVQFGDSIKESFEDQVDAFNNAWKH